MLSKIFYITGIVAFLSIFFLVFSSWRENAKRAPFPTPVASVSPMPTKSVTTTVTQVPQNEIFCTENSQCPTGYACQAYQSEGTVCTGQPCNPAVPRIIKGFCKLKEGGSCQVDDNCFQGLICHTIPGFIPQKKCASPVVSINCKGPADTTSCPGGYRCVQNCGPIHGSEKDPDPGYSCLANEVKTRQCAICLASNTTILTPKGSVPVYNLREGMFVWSVNLKGEKIASRIIKIGNTAVPQDHRVTHLVLSDKREVWVSPNHPTILHKSIGDLKVGDLYDNARIMSVDKVSYWDDRTYDLLPDSETGYYFANGILMGSTLK